jgi:phage tail-like protein
MTTGKRSDPFPSHIFAVEIGGVVMATFSECSGLQGEVEVFEYQEGGENGYVHRLPGRTKWTNLSLKRGLTDCPSLYEWYSDALRNKIVRQEISVVVYNQGGTEVRRWNVRAAYPVKWVGPQLKAGASEIAIETLDIAHHGIEQVK